MLAQRILILPFYRQVVGLSDPLGAEMGLEVKFGSQTHDEATREAVSTEVSESEAQCSYPSSTSY